MDDYLPTALIIVLSLNLVMFLGQAAIIDVADEVGNTQMFYNASGSLICSHDVNGCTGSVYTPRDDDPTSLLPTASTVEEGDGNFITDIFGSISSWFSDKVAYLTSLFSAPATFIGFLGLPEAAAFALGAVWYMFTLLVVVAFFWGR